ncbi:hypothetical protein RDI58_012854 [Solanum bulbocastanum]|uniref:Uncharacterized protein n=1 Tax=Solanum bulbocastanum TaxID=147425 RepID=A0AAN8YDI9_SOLBU
MKLSRCIFKLPVGT